MRHEITQWGYECWVGPDGVHFSDYGSLEKLARTAPHDCDVPGCLGPVNKRKLDLFAELLAACEAVETVHIKLTPVLPLQYCVLCGRVQPQGSAAYYDRHEDGCPTPQVQAAITKAR